MLIYRAYGLTIGSEIILPGMEPGEGAPDLIVRYGAVQRVPPEEIRANGYYGLATNDIHYVWRGICRVRIRAGAEIIVQQEGAGVDEAIINLVIGPFIALAMHQRGRLVLHGSGVRIAGNAVGFLGNSGQGKSTTVAAFLHAGYNVLTDDLLSIVEACEGFAAHLGSPQIKLWPESVRAIGENPEHLPKIASAKDKRLFGFRRDLVAPMLPLSCLYVLEEGQEQIEPLGPNEALAELARHSYCAVLVDELGDRQRHFLQCARLAAKIPVRRLRRPLSLEHLSRVIALVEEDLSAL